MSFKLPKPISFSLTRGDTKNMNITVGMDLTGKTVWFTAKVDIFAYDPQDATKVIQKQVTDHIDPVNGKTAITFVHEDTKDVTPGTYYADIQIVDNGQPITTSIFKIEITPDVTQLV